MTRLGAFAVLWLAACAANEPGGVDFDSSAGLIDVVVAGDGFVRYEGERVPWEAAVVRLRQRTRAMTDDQRARFVVHLRADPQEPGSDGAACSQETMNRLIDQLYVMGVLQVKFL